MSELRPYPLRRDAAPSGWTGRLGARLRAGLRPLWQPLAALGVEVQVLRALRACARPDQPGPAEHLRLARALRACEPRAGRRAVRAAVWLGRGSLVAVAANHDREQAFRLAALTLAQLPGGLHLAAGLPGDAERLFDLLRPDFEAAGLRLARLDDGDSPERRREALAADATVAGLRQLAFEHLRDRLRHGEELTALRLALRGLSAERAPAPVLRGLRRLLIQEADRALLDDARMPISAGGAGAPLFDRATAVAALRMASALEPGPDFELRPGGVPSLTPEGRRRAATMPEARMRGLDSGPRREQMLTLALTARHFLRRGHNYAVEEGRVVILDAATGRPTPRRAWGSGLQQVVEALEGLPLSPVQQAVAQITLQRFLGRYLAFGAVAADFEGLEAELARTYGRLCLRLGRRPARAPLRMTRDDDARLRLLTKLADGDTVAVSDDPRLSDRFPPGLIHVSREQAEAGLQPPPRRLLCLEPSDSPRLLHRIARRNGGAQVELVLSLEDPAFAGWRGRLLWWLWPVSPSRQTWAGALLWRHFARRGTRMARLRHLQVEAEHRQRATLAFAGKAV